MNGTDFFNGGDSILYIKFNDIFAPVACLTSHNISEVTDALETSVSTTNNPSWRTYTPDFQSYNLQASGLKINDQSGEFEARVSLPKLKTLKRTRVIFEWEVRTEGGQFIEAGTGFITSLNENAEVGAYISFDVTIQGVGQLSSFAQDNISFDRTDITWDNTDITFDRD